MAFSVLLLSFFSYKKRQKLFEVNLSRDIIDISLYTILILSFVTPGLNDQAIPKGWRPLNTGLTVSVFELKIRIWILVYRKTPNISPSMYKLL